MSTENPSRIKKPSLADQESRSATTSPSQTTSRLKGSLVPGELESSKSEETESSKISDLPSSSESRLIHSPNPNQVQAPDISVPPFQSTDVPTPSELKPMPKENTDSEVIPSAEDEVENKIEFPGWLAIDFGTSNSTVTLHDPGVRHPIKGLPQEQEQKLCEALQQWLEPLFYQHLGVSEGDWQEFIQEVNNPLNLSGMGDLATILSEGNSAELQEALKQIELSLVFHRSASFQRVVSQHLNELYHTVFREPPLKWQSLIPSILDIDFGEKGKEIPSELEITGHGSPLKVEMGHRARRDRLKAIADPKSNLNEIGKKFHHSPKRYLGQEQEINVLLDGKSCPLKVEELIKAAWNRLIELTDDYRQHDKDKFAKGVFRTAVVTYPAVAPPSVRHQIKKTIQELNLTDVQTDYDEAISSAMFFLWRELGGDLKIGLEAFKTRCHYEQQNWSQNLLIIDIGGGTTDLALIKLTLKEKNPFDPGEDRGLGGSYYVITPELLGSSGNLRLGGELITLHIFRLLKAALADALLTAVTEGSLQSQKLSDLVLQLSERFRDSNGQFRTGMVLASVDQERKDSPATQEALDAAEKVIPTRWAYASSRLQAFYKLWDKAEEAKLCLGKTPEPELFQWIPQDLADLLKSSGIDDYEPKDLGDLCNKLNSEPFSLSQSRFERAVSPVIRQAVNLANGLVENRKKQVDWLILSGKTCGLEQVSREIRQVFSESNYFTWNSAKVTFVPEYAKLATSVGACYIEIMRRFVYAPEKAKDYLRRGFNQLYIEVKNLSNSLPCAFKQKTLETGYLESLFEANETLYKLDSESFGKSRTKWLSTMLAIDILREDFEGQQILWGAFNGNNKIAIPLGMNEFEYRRNIQVQFEINQQLDIQLLFCRGLPHYLIKNELSSIDMNKALSDSFGETSIISDNKLEWDIIIDVDVSHAAQAPGGETKLLAAGSSYDEIFRYEVQSGQEMSQGKGLISQTWIEKFPESKKHQVYAQRSGTDVKRLIGEFADPEIETDYICRYRVSLDNRGFLRLHLGEIPYWESLDKAVLKNEGCVYRTDLELQPPRLEKDRDPFSGIH
jgi:hypothetical protein